jgi:hypothetical protein
VYKHRSLFTLLFSILLLNTPQLHLCEYASKHVSTKITFSPQSYTHNNRHSSDYSLKNSAADSSPKHQPHFKTYNAQDFRDYFSARNYTDNEILNQRCLYMFDEFVKFAQTYSAYTCTIQQIHAQLKNLTIIQKAYYIIKGTYCPGLQKRIHYLYDQLSTLKKEATPASQLPVIRDHAFETFSQQQTEYETLKDVYRAYAPSLSTAIAKRVDAFNSMKRGDFLELNYDKTSYNLTHNVKQLLNKYGYNTTQFTQCYGHKLHQAIHQESLDILEQVDNLSPNSLLYDHQGALIDFTMAMVDYNHEGITDKAMQIGDLCWTLLDYGQAIAEGAALGTYNAVTDIINNPIGTTINMVAGKQILAYQLCKVLYNVADIGVTALTDTHQAKNKWITYTKPLSDVINAINKKEITVRDALKGGTAFVVELAAQARLLGGLRKFCNTIKQKAIDFIQNHAFANPQKYLTTPEGLLLKTTAKAGTKPTQKITPDNISSTIPAFIKENRVPLDRETILHGANFKKTKINPVKGAQVYTDGKLLYHRDTLHTGKRAHLETYNKQGIHLGETDPITGKLMANTADKNKKLYL